MLVPPIDVGAVQVKLADKDPAVGVREVGAPGAVLTAIVPLAPERDPPSSPYSTTYLALEPQPFLQSFQEDPTPLLPNPNSAKSSLLELLGSPSDQ